MNVTIGTIELASISTGIRDWFFGSSWLTSTAVLSYVLDSIWLIRFGALSPLKE